MKYKINKIFILIALIMVVCSIFSVSIYAMDTESIISSMDGVNNNSGSNTLVKGINIIYTLIRVAGTGIALLMVLILGIKYMLTSVEEKAEIKKQAVPILVGSVLIFATSNILAIVIKIVEE